MSRFSVKNETNEFEGEIDPSDLIDIEENKPKNVDHEDLNKSEKGSEKVSTKKKTEPMVIERKPVSTLTEEEKTYLYNLYKDGGEHENFKVYFYKNGNHKIVRKKAPPKYNTAKRMLEQQKALDKEPTPQNPIMTNEQMLFSHIIDLEAKYATLYEKHKKLKKNYKTMYYDVYEDDQSNEIINEQNESIMEQSNEITKEQNESIKEDAQPPVSENMMEEPAMPENKYLNRVMRQARGYRKRMINNF